MNVYKTKYAAQISKIHGSNVESNLDKLLTKLLSRVVTWQKNLWDQLEKTSQMMRLAVGSV